MKTTPYRTIRDGVIQRMGIDPAQSLLPSQASAIAEYATSAAAQAWGFFDWPDIFLTEARTPVGEGFVPGVYTYESDYAGTTSYIGRAPQGSLFSESVWRIKRVLTTASGELVNIDTAIDVPWDNRVTATYVEDSNNAPAEEFIPYILLETPGMNVLGNVLSVYDIKPDEGKLTRNLSFAVTEDRLLITDTSYISGPVWVYFSLPQPRFTSTAFSAGAAYSKGDLVYYNTTGDCYEALQDTTGTLPTNADAWLRHRIPAFLADYIKFYSIAETLAEDGQYDKSQFQFLRAEGVLQQRMDDAWLRKGQVRTYSARFQ